MVVLAEALWNKRRTLRQLIEAIANSEPREQDVRGVQWAYTRRLATDEIASIQAAYLAGATVYELAAEHKVHRHTIATHLKAVGVPMRGRPLSEAQIEVAARLYESGLSLARVGESGRHGENRTTATS
jgi:hypothetical protein